MLSWPSTRPCGSKRVKQNWSTRSSSGTPYCRPIETEIAKQFIMLRNAAPSLCMSMKISPSVAVLVLAGAQEHLVTGDARLLREAVAAARAAGGGAAWRGPMAATPRQPRRLLGRLLAAELLSGWLCLQPSRYSATAFRPSFHDSV